MAFQAIATQADVLEPPADNFERRCLLRNEQDRLPVRQEVGDHVGDRLALAGTRWSNRTKSLRCAATTAASCELSAECGANRSDGSDEIEARRIDKFATAAFIRMGRCVDEVPNWDFA